MCTFSWFWLLWEGRGLVLNGLNACDEVLKAQAFGGPGVGLALGHAQRQAGNRGPRSVAVTVDDRGDMLTGIEAWMVSSSVTLASPEPHPTSRADAASVSVAMIGVVAFMIPRPSYLVL